MSRASPAAESIVAPSAHELLEWIDLGEDRHPIDRALIALGAFGAGRGVPGDLADLPIGARDAWLMRCRARFSGPSMRCMVVCPACAEPFEYDLSLPDLAAADRGGVGALGHHEWFDDEWHVVFRCPTSRDLAACVAARNTGAAYQQLLQRCLVHVAHRGAAAGALDDLPEPFFERLEREILARDPLAEVAMDMCCPACQHPWTAYFDIAACFWQELEAAAESLMADVHLIACHYHWSEAEILSMSARRRRRYLGFMER